jgi:hypothetical protein
VIYPGSTPVGNATLVVANVRTCNKHSPIEPQGLAHMGKGLIGLSPYHTDRQLLSGALVQVSGGLWGQADRVEEVCLDRTPGPGT